jgi:hypothetical protein
MYGIRKPARDRSDRAGENADQYTVSARRDQRPLYALLPPTGNQQEANACPAERPVLTESADERLTNITCGCSGLPTSS